LRWDPFCRRHARFPRNRIKVKPFASEAAAGPNISLSQVDPVPADQFLSCQRFRANAPVLVNGISMQIVEHVQQRGVFHLSQMNLACKSRIMSRKLNILLIMRRLNNDKKIAPAEWERVATESKQERKTSLAAALHHPTEIRKCRGWVQEQKC
jgi:hypothetical protein